MPQIDLDGTRLDATEAGAGEPVALVHGSASDARVWRAQQESFAEHFRVITYSRRYHWPNAPIPDGADYAMAEHVADLRALLDRLGAAPAHVVGHSYGALCALQLAIEAPEAVRSLVLIEPPAIRLFVSNTPTPPELLRVLVRRPRTALAIAKLGVRGLGPATEAARRGDMDEVMQLFGTAALGRETFARLSDERREQVRQNLSAAEFLGSGFLPLPDSAVRAVRAPTLLVNGARSPAVFHRLADRLEELLPRAERVEIPNASHIVQEDNPDAFTSAVLSFLAAHGGPEVG